VAITATAAAVAIGLAVLQTDWAGRKLLTPSRLLEKRFQSYIYAWNQAMELFKLKLDFFRSGKRIRNYQETPVSRIFQTDSEIQEFVKEVTAAKTDKIQYRIAKIDSSTSNQQNNNNNNEHSLYCFACHHDDEDDTMEKNEYIQIDPLSKFATQLADHLERIISTIPFCFLYDVAAGEASALCTGLLQPACKDHVRIIPNPTWLIQLGILAQQRVYATSKIQKIIYALCRWEAMMNPPCTTTGGGKDIYTIVVTIPTAMTPVLLPLLHDIFPDDRHVFAYTGCVQTCGYASIRRQAFQKTSIPQTLERAIQWDNPVAYTTPIQKWNSVHTMPPFPSALAALPVDMAGTVECWMAAVDMYLIRKEQLPATAFLPYVCKIDYLLNGSASTDAAEILPGTPQYWAVRSLLQYMTGHKSRELSSETMDAAIAYLRDYQRTSSDNSSLLQHPYAGQIENVVFHHKLILIANKILLDTVAPTEHWTLKQAMKRGCACCMPEEDDEEVEIAKANKYVDGKNKFAFDPTAFTSSGKQSNYTDGKSGFAFDPTEF
jgi:hypothetical protein